MEIVKCQRSLFPLGQILWYNKDRSKVLDWQGANKTWDRLFGPVWDKSARANKFFAEVEWTNPREPPRFIRVVKEENW